MTDLDITRLCAEAMGYGITKLPASEPAVRVFEMCDGLVDLDANEFAFDPLYNDAQCFALVKKFEISIAWSWVSQVGCMARAEAEHDEDKRHDNISCRYKNLNRAICECVARMQQAKAR